MSLQGVLMEVVSHAILLSLISSPWLSDQGSSGAYSISSAASGSSQYVEQFGIRCLLLARDLRDPASSPDIIAETLRHYNRLDLLINNAAVQPFTSRIMDISNEQLENTFWTNIFPLLYLTKAALPYLDNQPYSRTIRSCGSNTGAST